MFTHKTRLALLALTAVAFALPAENVTAKPRKLGKRCTGTISSAASVAAAVECTTIIIGEAGSISFPYYQWDGPLMIVKGDSVTFNGAGFSLLGNGDQYWDGEGTGGGKTKPAPLLRINHSGTFKDTIIKNSPARGISVGGASIVVDTVTVDNTDGDALGANTDGFDVSSDGPVTIQNSKVHGQDDCLAINRGNDITFTGNTCTGPTHGISVGSITSDTTVSNVVISKNTVTGAVNGLRIKTDASATDSFVNGVTYTGNVLTGITAYGVIIDQSYSATLGTPGTGVIIEDIVFSGTNTISVGSSAHRLEINCGSTASCPGTWNLAGLDITGGVAGVVKNVAVTGGTY
ncbi:glycoside hydrolase family 28 protein [Athelia psychrophila]|uniref:endo-polygalacturonase n=1 Tax=Athelia psychrophila TaxID=1759441 RepID=A0A166FEZ9_9AGAM|nr:glycoside hydrolase family 28 protein [Fibularhizoctonia sp. CBS 109695]